MSICDGVRGLVLIFEDEFVYELGIVSCMIHDTKQKVSACFLLSAMTTG